MTLSGMIDTISGLPQGASPDLSGDAPLDLSHLKPVEAARAIKRARLDAGLTQAELAERMGIPQSVVSTWESGASQSWRRYAERLASTLSMPKGHFVALEPGQPIGQGVVVVGEVQAGVFRAALEWSDEDRFQIPVGAVGGFEPDQLCALRVVGPSMDLVYPDGSYVIVARALDTDVRDGDRVVVHVQRGGLWEATLKEVRVEGDGRIALWPRSSHPEHQTPIYLDAGDQDAPRITYVVVARYAEERRPTAPPQVIPLHRD